MCRHNSVDTIYTPQLQDSCFCKLPVVALNAVYLRVPIHSMDVCEELHVFGAVPVRKKDEILDEGRDSMYFQVFPWHFYFMRGHSLVELTEHDDNAADIILRSM